MTVKRPTTIREQSKAKPRKRQVGLSVLTGAIALGIITYIIIQSCNRCAQKSRERKHIKAMQVMNTIVVGSDTPNRHEGNSESRGLIQTNGPSGPGMAGLNEEDFDETSKSRKKMRISEAIEEADGTKKPAKKGKKKRNAKRNAADNDLLNVQQIDEGNDSWDSSRAHAKQVDLAGPGGFSSAGGMNDHQEYYTSGKINLRNNGSSAQISAQDQLNQLEEVADLSNRGSKNQAVININDIDDGFGHRQGTQ